ncbi:MAG TPA: circadian clock protein KaiC [Candidatus Limnocylindrales bacterium]|nr:circadian clock protein KaiC [Candidatus Limnocylindrales bacterium]
MSKGSNGKNGRPPGIRKSLTGIKGLDEITQGGLPQGRPTLICGSAGSGKTMLAIEFLVHGALEQNEPGVFMAFEETKQELAQNVASLGFDLEDLIARKKLYVDYVHIDPSEIHETGDYDLEGLFVRLQLAIDTVGAKRVALDTLEALFSGLGNQAVLRAEIRRLFRWLKDRSLTSVITGERGEGVLTRYGLEEYVSDCVILLDNRIKGQVATRRMRIVKYRGTAHGVNEYPFLIDETGFSVLPVTSLGLQHQASTQRVPTGIAGLDEMLGGKGFFRGSTTLVSGNAGSGKTSMSAHFADATCSAGERCAYFALEESLSQVARNMKSIGIDIKRHIDKGLLHFHAWRPSSFSLEMHLVRLHKLIEEAKPSAVIVDPISNLTAVAGDLSEVTSALTRLIDFLKMKQITTMFTSLNSPGSAAEATDVGVSSLIDTWLLVRDVEANGERNRGLYVIKSRGMAHSNQVREFLITSNGVRLIPAYLGVQGVLTGTSRVIQEAQETATRRKMERELERKRFNLETKRKAMEAQIAVLRAEYEVAGREIMSILEEAELVRQQSTADHAKFAKSRGSNGSRQAPVAAGRRLHEETQ